MLCYNRIKTTITLLFCALLVLSFLTSPVFVANATPEDDSDECPEGTVLQNGVDCIPVDDGGDNGENNQAQQPPIDSSQSFLTYEHPIHGYTIQYPSNWDVTDENDMVTLSDPNDIPFSGSVLLSKYSDIDVPLDDFVTANLERYNKTWTGETTETTNFKLLGSSTTDQTLGGQPAYKLEYTQQVRNLETDETIILRSTEIGAKFGNDYYTLIYTGRDDLYAELLPIARKMVDTFQVAGQASG